MLPMISAGKPQRIATARAVVRKAPILILGEPSTGLDEKRVRAVVEALERQRRRRTTFLITHDLDLAAQANLILYLVRARIVECGTRLQLLKAQGRYAALQRMQRATRDAAVQGAVSVNS